MAQPTVVIRYKNILLFGVLGVVSILFQLGVFWYLQDLFVEKGVLLAVVVGEVIISILAIVKGCSKETLDGNGIVFQSPFGTKEYPWISVESYGVETVNTKNGVKPRISVRFRDEKKRRVIPCDADIARCLQHYLGAPAYDNWGKEFPGKS